MTMLSRTGRHDQRVYFANTPWWVPMLTITLVFSAALGLAAYIYWDGIVGFGPVHEQMQAHVDAHRDGDAEALGRLAETAHTTVEDDRTVYGAWSETGENCWAVRVDTDADAGVGGQAPVAGPLPGDDLYCP